ncbi:conserved protein of unknown function (plasmid) [Rhodovastum atsumiense]|uniref:KOW domain-containing protein n=1 Tax=Rhodovastum atsumiense TaxID=504468 RepID=A0A5M6IN32_9PROT|nr:hypothetical protein [Rhodovastum atsumiense]KAA5609666.1 hypothetical protein F1189_23180 [Rhodovastum atsumiense]CAH2606429.1 conserved protein of unknown function [Rhodovastum atsumiense]
MASFRKGQRVSVTRKGKTVEGKFVGEEDAGAGRGGGIWIEVDLGEGKTTRARPAQVSAA